MNGVLCNILVLGNLEYSIWLFFFLFLDSVELVMTHIDRLFDVLLRLFAVDKLDLILLVQDILLTKGEILCHQRLNTTILL